MNKQDLIQLLTDNEMVALFEQLSGRQRYPGEQVLLEGYAVPAAAHALT